MTCTDWRTILRPASFRGVPFFVEEDDADYGRRLVVHEFPNRDAPFVEDMGEKATHYRFTAYVVGDNALAAKSALVAACRRRGPGQLVIPSDGTVTVRCRTCKRSRERDRAGYIAFSMEFVTAGAGLLASPIGLIEALVGAAAGAAISQITAAFSATFSTLRADAWVVNSALGAVGGALAAIDEVRSGLVMSAVAAPQLLGQLTALANRIEDAVVTGADVIATQATGDLSTSSRQEAEVSLPVAMSEIMTTLREGASDEITAARGLWLLVDHGRPDAAPMSSGVSETQAAANATAVNALVRRLALVELAVAVAQADFPDRAAAVMWRARVAEAFEDEIATATGSLAAALSDVRGGAIGVISRKVADLQPVITVEASRSASSIVWAWRLYADATMASELVARNGVAHPSYMPLAFAAAAAPVNGALTKGERALPEVF